MFALAQGGLSIKGKVAQNINRTDDLNEDDHRVHVITDTMEVEDRVCINFPLKAEKQDNIAIEYDIVNLIFGPGRKGELEERN